MSLAKDKVYGDLKNIFFLKETGKALFLNLIGAKEDTKQLLDEILEEPLRVKKTTFVVRTSVRKVDTQYANGVRYALLWKDIVAKLAEVVTVNAIAGAVQNKEHAMQVRTYWVEKLGRDPREFNFLTELNKIQDAYNAFAKATPDNLSGAFADHWLDMLIKGYDILRVQVLIVIEDFDVTLEVFPKEEGYGVFYQKLFTLTPKNDERMVAPYSTAIMVVSENPGDDIAHSISGSIFSAGYLPVKL